MADLFFPLVPGFAFTGGPVYSTSIVENGAGYETPNRNWRYPKHAYTVVARRSQADMEALIQFFHAVNGKYATFLLKDYADYLSCPINVAPSATDQALGTGDGTTVRFPLIKTYTVGATSQQRLIRKPMAGSLLVAVAGTPTTSFTFDDSTGEVVFGTAPGSGQALTAGYAFYVPCRFDTDELQTVIEDRQVVSVSAPIVERRL